MSLLPPKDWNRLTGYITTVPGEDGCWEWLGKRDHNGYGRYWLWGSWRQAHRITYMYLSEDWTQLDVTREIPEDQPTLDHGCNNRQCVRPSHLTPMTLKKNHEFRAERYWARKKQEREAELI